MIRLASSVTYWDSPDFTWTATGGYQVAFNHNQGKLPINIDLYVYNGGKYNLAYDLYFNGSFDYGWASYTDGSHTLNTYYVYVFRNPNNGSTTPAKGRLFFD